MNYDTGTNATETIRACTQQSHGHKQDFWHKISYIGLK